MVFNPRLWRSVLLRRLLVAAFIKCVQARRAERHRMRERERERPLSNPLRLIGQRAGCCLCLGFGLWLRLRFWPGQPAAACAIFMSPEVACNRFYFVIVLVALPFVFFMCRLFPSFLHSLHPLTTFPPALPVPFLFLPASVTAFAHFWAK